MNKTAIKNFAIWARNKLIADIQYRAGLMGITSDGIKDSLPQSTGETEFYDIGTAKPYTITGDEIRQRRSLVDVLNRKTSESDYKTAYKYIIEGVAYTWFNRLIAIRFMEVNEYLPSHVRVLSSESGKSEPDLVTNPFDADLDFTDEEKEDIIRLKQDNKLGEVFRLLFIKQCNALNEILPALFEQTADYTEVLLNVSAIDKEGVVWHLVNDIPEEDFDVEQGGQVEIIGWLYQYYNTEPKNEAFAKKGKITKDEIPAVTQLFTPDWIVRYMVENSLGRLWVEGHPDDLLKSNWKYYLEEAEQEPEVQAQLDEIHKEYAKLNPEDIHFMDPCMGSGHILVYAFDVLMQIYESVGYSQRDAAKSILAHNLYGLDIDDRAYQMAYFAVMMKARQYNRRILSADTKCNVYSIKESNGIKRNQLEYFGAGLSDDEKKIAIDQVNGLLDTFKDAKEYGSILNVEKYDWELLKKFAGDIDVSGQMTLDEVGIEETKERLQELIAIGETMARKYEVVVTNPPYMSISNGSTLLQKYVKKEYQKSKVDLFSVFIEKCNRFTGRLGFQAMITMQAWMFQGSFEDVRSIIIRNSILSLLHLGARAFDEISGEVVQTVSFILRKKICENYTGFYYRLVDYLGENKKEEAYLESNCRHIRKQNRFDSIPGSVLAYWVSDSFNEIFKKDVPLANIAFPRQGIHTGDNNLYLRLWHEVEAQTICFKDVGEWDMDYKWAKLNKGGTFRKWYGNKDYIILWKNDGEAIKRGKSVGANNNTFFRKLIGFTDITTNMPSFRYYGAGFIYDVSGPSLIMDNPEYSAYYLLGLLNSVVTEEAMQILSPTIHINQTALSKITIGKEYSEIKDEVETLTKHCVGVAKTVMK